MAVAVFASGLLLGSSLIDQSAPTTTSPRHITYSVDSGAVEQRLATSVSFSWPLLQEIDLLGDGRLTWIAPAATLLEEGAVVARVDEEPVFVALGPVPAFRPMRPGDSGEDVRQLQEFLGRRGLFEGPVDGRYGRATAVAVAEWTSSQGLERSAEVPYGRLLFVPSLPSLLFHAEGLRLGSALPSPALELHQTEPDATVAVQPGQQRLVDPGDEVLLVSADSEIPIGVVDGLPVTEVDGSLSYPVSLGNPVAVLDSVLDRDNAAKVSEAVDLVVVPYTEGARVPAAAVATNAQGATGVVLEDGTFREVQVLEAVDGFAILDGVDVGERVLVGER